MNTKSIADLHNINYIILYTDIYCLLRQINQSLRNVKIPLNNWRTADKGHFHWKWGNKETEEWFWLRK